MRTPFGYLLRTIEKARNSEFNTHPTAHRSSHFTVLFAPVPMSDILPYSFRQIAVSLEEGMIVQPDFQVLEMMGGIPGEPMDLLIRTGVSLEAIDNLSRHGVSAVSVGIINARTLRHRRTKGERLSPEEGDRLYRVSKLVVLAEQVFGDKDKAAHWLNKAQKAFGGLTALEAAATTPGYVAAEETLERINHGFFA
ncbi:hypothetical protein CFII64_25963 [Pseudomonas sp. CFII64]|nr:hypothetical protein CFII64_25963 [Pseudomonas sp. CFII64]